MTQGAVSVWRIPARLLERAEAALPHWMGISHEIDQLRRKWLLEKCCK